MATNTTIKSEKELLTERLQALLINRNDGIAINIKGAWGIGKTHFWQKFAEQFKSNQYAYVSLFGAISLNDIKQDIILQTSLKNKIADKIKKKVGSTKILGLDLAAALALMDKSDFKNVTICFDDLERLSDKLDLRDVMGLIAQFKEQKKCNIVIISNEDQLAGADRLNDWSIEEIAKDQNKEFKVAKYQLRRSQNHQIFTQYAEKIIDFSFTYAPLIEENFGLIADKLKYFDKPLICNFLVWTHKHKSYKNFNIRLLIKLINALNIFSFLEEHHISPQFKEAIAAIIFTNVHGSPIDHRDFNPPHLGEAHRYIVEACNKSFITNKPELLNQLRDKEKRLLQADELTSFRALSAKYNFDLNYQTDDYIKDTAAFIEKYQHTIISMIGLYEFKQVCEHLTELGQPQSESILSKVVEAHIDSIANEPKGLFHLFNMNFEKTFKKHPKLISYAIEKRDSEETNTALDDYQSILSLMKKLLSNSGWNNDDISMVNSISPTIHKAFMQRGAEYLKTAFELARWSNSFSNESSFANSATNILNAMQQLANENVHLKQRLQPLIVMLTPEESHTD